MCPSGPQGWTTRFMVYFLALSCPQLSEEQTAEGACSSTDADTQPAEPAAKEGFTMSRCK